MANKVPASIVAGAGVKNISARLRGRCRLTDKLVLSVPRHARHIRSHYLDAAEVAGVIFSDSDTAPVPKFLNLGPVQIRQFFKFKNPTPVQT